MRKTRSATLERINHANCNSKVDNEQSRRNDTKTPEIGRLTNKTLSSCMIDSNSELVKSEYRTTNSVFVSMAQQSKKPESCTFNLNNQAKRTNKRSIRRSNQQDK